MAKQNRTKAIWDLWEQFEKTGLIPPQDLSMEQSVLGIMIADSSSIGKIIEILGPPVVPPEIDFNVECVFFKYAHALIYDAAATLFLRDGGCDLLTLTHALRERGVLEKIGGPSYLVELTGAFVSSVFVIRHCRLLLQIHLARKAIMFCELLRLQLRDKTDDIFTLLAQATATFSELESVRHNKREVFRPLYKVAGEAIKELDRISKLSGELTGVTSGLADVDELTGGWQPTDLIILAARPSQGKTALLLNFAAACALHPEKAKRKAVAFFSLEMSDVMLTLRVLAAQSGVDLQRARKGQMDEDEWRLITNAWTLTEDAPLFLFDAQEIGMHRIAQATRELVTRLSNDNIELGLVIIDYIQLVDTDDPQHGESREREVSKISRSLKGLAKELQVPVIAASQLSRDVDKRKNNEPVLSDLRESGALEQDSDLVWFIYRAETYGLTVDEWNRPTKGIAKLICAKQRNGPVGSKYVKFKPETGRYSSLPVELPFNDAASAPPTGQGDLAF